MPILALLLIVLAVVCATTGCAPTVVVTPPPAVLGTGSAIVLKVQSMVHERCRFLVTADTVGAVLGSAYLPEDVADQICLAVLQTAGERGTGRVNGVPIRGRFMR
jgi:hypothetical protein